MSETLSPTSSNQIAPASAVGRRGLSFAAKLLISMCGLVLLTGIVIIAVADRSNRGNTRAMVYTLFHEVSRHAVTQTKDFILRAAPVAQTLGQFANQGLALDDLDRLGPQLLAFLKGNPGMTWVLYGNEAGDYTGATRLRDGKLHIERTHIVDGHTHLVEYEVQKDNSWKVFRKDDDSGYDPRKRPFYILAREKQKLAWTRPYMFFTQNVAGISCVMPVYQTTGKLRGVFSVDFDLNALSEFVGRLSVSRHSSVFLFTPDQTLLAHRNEKDLHGKGMKGSGRMLTLADTGDPLVDAFRQHLPAEFLHDTAADSFHFFEFNHAGADYLASTTAFSVGDGQSWIVGAIAPQSDFLAAAWRMRWLSLAVAAAALAVAALLAAMMARHISRPVESLIGFMQRVGAGDLDAKADFNGGREFRQVSMALNGMIADLRERLHLRNSLKIAMDVQKSLLPEKDPTSPFLDIAGRSKYCDETGGDYYDFIDITSVSPSSLLVAVGDVTGHGIPSALVMATARAALRTSALNEHRLADLMTRTNRVLASDNRHHRFMTLYLLMIDAESRAVRWASAGHDPAIVFDPQSQSFRELEGGDLPLGIAETTMYEEFTTDPLPQNSVLVIGTDGVWEMFDKQDEMYGKQRLQNIMRRCHDQPAAKIAAALEADLAAFRGEKNPMDDVTFVVIKLIKSPPPDAPA